MLGATMVVLVGLGRSSSVVMEVDDESLSRRTTRGEMGVEYHGMAVVC